MKQLVDQYFKFDSLELDLSLKQKRLYKQKEKENQNASSPSSTSQSAANDDNTNSLRKKQLMKQKFQRLQKKSIRDKDGVDDFFNNKIHSLKR